MSKPSSNSQAAPSNPTNTNNGSGSGGNDPFQTRTTRRKTYYQSSVYQFTCRGALHLHNTTDEQTRIHAKPSQQQQQEFNNASVEGMGEALRDRYSCRGIQSRLRHVADFPLSRSKEEAVQWFEGSPAFNRDVSNNGSNGRMRVDGNDYGRGGGLKLKRGTKPKKDDDERENTNLNSKNRNQKNETQTAKTPTDEEPQETHSSYGTTQVNILTVRPVPVLSPDEAQRNQQLMADPFGGFGNVANAGMLNPFGSLFGGFFGGGGGVPSSFPASSSSSSMMSRSVSSSTRMTRDENGKRIATTVTKTTTVDGTGKKRVETETSVRYLDDEGGRVETTKQVVEDGASSSAGTDGAATTTQPKKEKRRHTARSLSPRGFEDSDHHPLPFHHQSQSPSPPSRPIVDSGGAVVDPSVPPSPYLIEYDNQPHRPPWIRYR